MSEFLDGLVGMTQGARKRAAYRDAQREYESGWTVIGCWSGYSIPWDRCVAEARARYRIGERLRPCRGCRGCTLAIIRDDGEIVEVWQGMEHPRLPVCDGSGVLPARRQS